MWWTVVISCHCASAASFRERLNFTTHKIGTGNCFQDRKLSGCQYFVCQVSERVEVYSWHGRLNCGSLVDTGLELNSLGWTVEDFLVKSRREERSGQTPHVLVLVVLCLLQYLPWLPHTSFLPVYKMDPVGFDDLCLVWLSALLWREGARDRPSEFTSICSFYYDDLFHEQKSEVAFESVFNLRVSKSISGCCLWAAQVTCTVTSSWQCWGPKFSQVRFCM